MDNRSDAVDAYIKQAPDAHREALRFLRELIHEVDPALTEAMQYKMPTFNRDGTMVTGFASRKHYVSLYCDTEAVERHRDDLGKLNCGKGCIRFRKLADLPIETIRTILAESAARAAVS